MAVGLRLRKKNSPLTTTTTTPDLLKDTLATALRPDFNENLVKKCPVPGAAISSLPESIVQLNQDYSSGESKEQDAEDVHGFAADPDVQDEAFLETTPEEITTRKGKGKFASDLNRWEFNPVIAGFILFVATLTYLILY